MNTQDRLLTIQDVAQRLRISGRAVYRLIASGEIPQPVKLGRSSRIPEGDLVEFLNKLKQQRN